MRFKFIEDHRKRWPVQTMCRLLKVSSSGFYQWSKDQRRQTELAGAREQRATRLLTLIKAIHAQHKGYGSPRIHRELLAHGETLQYQNRRPTDAASMHCSTMQTQIRNDDRFEALVAGSRKPA